MLFFCAFFFAFAAIAFGSQTTSTILQCQTQFGSLSPFAVATHTTTVNSELPRVTIAMTTQEVVTITPGEWTTYDQTITQVSTITENFTEENTGSVFSTTLTRYVNSAPTIDLTFTTTEPFTTTVLSTILLNFPTRDGFRPINTTATSSSASNVASTSTTASAKMVYFVKDGKLALTPFSALTKLLTHSGTISGPQSSTTKVTESKSGTTIAKGTDTVKSQTMTNAATVTSVSTVLSASSSKVTESLTTTSSVSSSKQSISETGGVPSDTEATTASGQTSTISEMVALSKTSPSVPKTPEGTEQGSVQKHTIKPRAITERSETINKSIMGFQGAITSDPVRGDVVFPTSVTCTKILVTETTVFEYQTREPAYVGAKSVTNFITTLSTLTVTKTIPYKKPFKTASFITTSTISWPTTSTTTVTEISTFNYTMSSTTTSHLACATNNFVGPVTNNGSQIINVYTRGMEKYTTFDIGYARNAEDCCIECHVTSNERPCLGTIFQNWKCYLLRDLRSLCHNQNSGAGYFVSRPKEEVAAWEKSHRHQHLPEYVMSNGPCGYFYDGGIGT